MMTLAGKKIVLGVSGGIAAYKTRNWCADCVNAARKCVSR
jgi:phosphopantothenoylcysteine synthetase/decarboxylase